jgi:ethanolamine utilization microcompartment shell protein EutS
MSLLLILVLLSAQVSAQLAPALVTTTPAGIVTVQYTGAAPLTPLAPAPITITIAAHEALRTSVLFHIDGATGGDACTVLVAPESPNDGALICRANLAPGEAATIVVDLPLLAWQPPVGCLDMLTVGVLVTVVMNGRQERLREVLPISYAPSPPCMALPLVTA